MLLNLFKKKGSASRDAEPAQVEISSTGVLSVSTKALLKNDSIKNQYKLLNDPEYRKILQGR